MKKNFLYAAALTLCMSFDENGGNGGNTGGSTVEEIDITSENAANWYVYMTEVARRLHQDATDLYNYWNTEYNNSGHSYADIFKNHNVSGYFQTAALCVQQIIDGCYDIANEVGDAKIGDPYDMYVAGDTQGALYAVESWFSWHSREDYSNNIISIYSAIAGSRDVVASGNQLSLENSAIAEHSVYNVLKDNGYADLADRTMQAIKNAHDAILAIPAPFRSHINSQEALNAQDACLELATLLQKELRGVFEAEQPLASDALLNEVVNTYVDDVVLPTYYDLMNSTDVLLQDVAALADNPTNAGFESTAAQWIESRAPWEKSEAFLFGPVADKGLDPNMDSWPLDATAIVNILNTADWGNLDWDGEFIVDENGDPIESIADAQNVRGFHTLEFLLFKDGKARTVPAN